MDTIQDTEIKVKKPEPTEVIEAKHKYTKENPHETGAYWDAEKGKWFGYKAKVGFSPPWMPFNPKRQDFQARGKKVTMNERKFLMIYSQTGNLSEAWKAVYRYGVYTDKRLEDARVRSAAKRKIERIKKKAPEWAEAFLFEDITPDYIKKEMQKLYNHDHATIAERTRLLELMGKTQALFTDKVVSDIKIKDVVNEVYRESENDFPVEADQRLTRKQADINFLEKIGVA